MRFYEVERLCARFVLHVNGAAFPAGVPDVEGARGGLLVVRLRGVVCC